MSAIETRDQFVELVDRLTPARLNTMLVVAEGIVKSVADDNGRPKVNPLVEMQIEALLTGERTTMQRVVTDALHWLTDCSFSNWRPILTPALIKLASHHGDPAGFLVELAGDLLGSVTTVGE